MNQELINQLIAGVRLVQSLTGETVTIAGTDYPSTASTMVSAEPEFVAGGMIEKQSIILTVLKADFPNAPVTDTIVQFRGLDFRIIGHEDAALSWQIQLVQEHA